MVSMGVVTPEAGRSRQSRAGQQLCMVTQHRVRGLLCPPSGTTDLPLSIQNPPLHLWVRGSQNYLGRWPAVFAWLSELSHVKSLLRDLSCAPTHTGVLGSGSLSAPVLWEVGKKGCAAPSLTPRVRQQHPADHPCRERPRETPEAGTEGSQVLAVDTLHMQTPIQASCNQPSIHRHPSPTHHPPSPFIRHPLSHLLWD